MLQNDEINKFIDKEGRVKIWPSKTKYKLIVLEYLASKFEKNKDYSEKEVNDILKKFHTFNDHVLLRRELCDNEFMDRMSNGSKYWISPGEVTE